MERLFTKTLEEWFHSNDKRPMLVYGARQVGKTHIINEFCQNCGKKYYQFDLLENKTINNIFNNDSDIKSAINNFSVANNIDLNSNDIIIFFDEVQKSEKVIEALKYFNIYYPHIDIICAGSLLGVELKKMSASFPVGYVREFQMYPLNFKEFLMATNNSNYIPIIEECFKNNTPINETFHSILINLYKNFLILGGMPRIVQNYIDNNMEMGRVNYELHKDIISEYQNDIAKNIIDDREKIRTIRIYDHIVPELAKDNPKFTYAKLDQNDNRKSDYITSLDWLLSSNIVLACYQVNNPTIPLKGYINYDAYKLFMNDIGLLCYRTDINKGTIILDEDYPFKGRIAENFVACELKSNNIDLTYFTKKNENNNGLEIDFLIQTKDGVIPIEVKASNHTKSKSLNSFNNSFKPKYSIRISSKNFGIENDIKSVPLYATFCINKEM